MVTSVVKAVQVFCGTDLRRPVDVCAKEHYRVLCCESCGEPVVVMGTIEVLSSKVFQRAPWRGPLGTMMILILTAPSLLLHPYPSLDISAKPISLIIFSVVLLCFLFHYVAEVLNSWAYQSYFLFVDSHLWRRQWHPTPVLLPGKPHGWRAWKAAVHGVAEGRTRLSDFTFLFTFMHWRRKWQPTPAFLPGESQGWGSLLGYRLWGHTESDTTEMT